MSWMEKFKTIWLVTGSLTLLAAVSIIYGHIELAGVCVGALAGWIGGNKNGQR